MTKTILSGSLLAVVALVACTAKEPTRTGPINDPSSASPMASGTMAASDMNPPDTMAAPTAQRTDPAGSAMPMTSASAAPVEPQVRTTEGNVAALLDAVNGGEIEHGTAAQQQAQSPAVKAFAKMMVEHHTQARDKQAALMSKLAIKPVDTTKSKELQASAKTMLDSLKPLKGAAFDKAYVDAQVKGHQDALDLINKDLLPNIQSAEYKKLVEEMRGKVEAHLKAAQELQKKLPAK